ncbi:MAG: LamG domain-containing protein [Xanthobacteraceae bacterium]
MKRLLADLIRYPRTLAVACGLLVAPTALPAQAQGCAPPPAGLVSWWPLDEKSGTAVADLMGKNPGTMTDNTGTVGMPIGVSNTSDPMSSEAMVGNGLTFFGNSRATIKPNPSLNLDNTSFTISAWVKKTGNAEWINLITSTPDRFELVIYQGRPALVMGSGHWPGSPIKPNTWTFVAAVFELSKPEVTVYSSEGGPLVRSGPFLLAPAGGGTPREDIPVVIGGCNGDRGWCDAALDEVDIYNVALDQKELQRIVNAGKSGKCKPVPPAKGMTWVAGAVNATTGTITVGCGNPPNRCDPYVGDRPCTDTLPLLCFKPSKFPPPKFVDDKDTNNRWSGGIVGATLPVAPAAAPINGSLKKANERCEEEFGKGIGWRLAEFHDGAQGKGGWNFQAFGNVGKPPTRHWTHISDQKKGTCFPNP